MPANDLEHIRSVLDRNRNAITARYRAIGTGIGKRARGDTARVIVVYLESECDRPSEPVSVEGVPLKFEVTGAIRFLKR